MSDTVSVRENVDELIARWDELALTGEPLYDEYTELVTEDFLRAISPVSLARIRDYLLTHDVAVERRRGLHIMTALVNLIPPESRRTQHHELSNISEGTARERNGTSNGTGMRNLIAREMLKAFRSDEIYGGTVTESITEVHENYDLKCDALGVPDDLRVSLVFVVLRGAALEYYKAEVRANASSVPQIFNAIRDHFITEDRRQHALSLWNTLSFASMRAEMGENPRAAEVIEALVTRAHAIQKQLSKEYQSDTLLRDCLARSVQGESFAALLSINPASTSYQLAERLAVAASTADVEAKTYFNRRYGRGDLYGAGQVSRSAFAQRPTNGRQEHVHRPANDEANERVADHRGTNKLGSDGKPLQCHHCKSPYHYMRACPVRSTGARTYFCEPEGEEAEEEVDEQALNDTQVTA